jgi:hypothetical protein
MDWTNGVRFAVGAGIFSPRYLVQTGFWAHPTSYPMGAGSSFSGRGAKPTIHLFQGQECVDVYLHSLNTSSRRGALFKRRDNFTFAFIPQ